MNISAQVRAWGSSSTALTTTAQLALPPFIDLNDPERNPGAQDKTQPESEHEPRNVSDSEVPANNPGAVRSESHRGIEVDEEKAYRDIIKEFEEKQPMLKTKLAQVPSALSLSLSLSR